MDRAQVHLEPVGESGVAVDALVAATGGRVGLTGLLDDLDRSARRSRSVLTRARTKVGPAFTWDLADEVNRRWWPQGITTSADADLDGRGGEQFGGRDVVIISAYARSGTGSRISVLDVTDPRRIRYRHVLLVRASMQQDGRVELAPVEAHAGGLVWHGRHLHVAATRTGFYTFSLDDIVDVRGVEVRGVEARMIEAASGDRLDRHRYVLPVRLVHRARTAPGATPFRYSFLSSTRGDGRTTLMAGEYGTGQASTRLAEFAVDPSTELPAVDPEGRVRPVRLGEGVPRMQGAVRVGRRSYLSTSNGRFRRGSIWVGEPGDFRQLPGSLPAGPEDLSYWSSRDQLWSVTEYPGRRRVITLDRSELS